MASGGIATHAYRSAPKPAGPLSLDKSGIFANATGYWAFNESSGAAVNLANPGTGNATLQSAASRGTDAVGSYYSGAKNVSSYASTGLTASALGIGGTTAKTTFCRFSASSQAYANQATLGTYTGALFYCGSGATNAAWGFRQSSPTNPPSDKWLVNVNTSPAATEIEITPTVDTLHTLVMTWDGTTNIRVYVDGSLVQTIATAVNTVNDRNFDIGRMLPASGVAADRWHFQGKIYEIGVIGGIAWSASDVAVYDANPVLGLSVVSDRTATSASTLPKATSTSTATRTIPVRTADGAATLPKAQSLVLGTFALASGDEFTSEFTSEFTNGTTPVTGTSSAILPQPTATATAARTIPDRTATASATLPKAQASATAFRTVPGRDGMSASVLPKPTSASTAVRSIPDIVAASPSTLPNPTAAATALRTIPNRTATSSATLPRPATTATATRTAPGTANSASTLPKLRTATVATRTIPDRAGASAAVIPFPRSSATAIRLPLPVAATSSSTLPKVFTVAVGQFDVPLFTAASSSRLPKPNTDTSASSVTPQFAGQSAGILPLLGTLAQGHFISPDAADVVGVVHLTGTVAYDIELTGEVMTDIDLQGEVIVA